MLFVQEKASSFHVIEGRNVIHLGKERPVVKVAIVLMANGNHRPSDALMKEIQNRAKQVAVPYKYSHIVEWTGACPNTISGKFNES